MARRSYHKSKELNLLDSVDLSGVANTRKGVHEALLNKLRDKYGLSKNVNVHAALNYGSYLRQHRGYSSKAGGYIDNRTGLPWNEKTIRAQLKTDRSAALQTHRAAHPLSIAGRKIGGVLERINKFSEAQGARNALNEHLQTKAQNWWHIKNQLSPLDQDTGLRLNEINFNKKTKLLQDRVNQLENKDITRTYQPPAAALKILEPKPVQISGQEVGQIVGGDFEQTPLQSQNNISQDLSPTADTTITDTTQQPKGNTIANGNTESEVTSKTESTKNDPEPHLGSWRRGSGESLKGADARTEKWLVSKGVDINQISKHDRREVYRNLRIGGPHIVNGMLQLNTGDRGANSRFSLKINQS